MEISQLARDSGRSELRASCEGQLARDISVHVDVDDLCQLRNIEPGHLYLVTKQHLMRGFDYRCSAGLAVLIARKLDSRRALR